ncbi:putative mediator of RNA polymerase II transcription subunit 26 [Calliphora vicina]|uniref:putative mediator of RNA polymerase II transcription subunit 26 n=1 Tax=Calliphora vicina TaxID=7373 RepID=UPI00325A9EAB
MTEYVTPNIHTVLKKYQTSAPKSLQGPGHSLHTTSQTAASANANIANLQTQQQQQQQSAQQTNLNCPCPLDVSLNNGPSSLVSDIHGLVTMRNSPCELIKTAAHCPSINTNSNSTPQPPLSSSTSSLSVATNVAASNAAAVAAAAATNINPALPLIKKEIMSSPEPALANTHDLPAENPLQQTAPTIIPPPSIKIMPPPPPEVSQPILSAADSGSGELYETRLEGKTIGCFSLGGEMRLCLPQFLNNVLAEFSLEQINRSFDDLGIFCSQCTPDQLMEFKAAKILPSDVKSSGLITRTDAERLCAILLHRSDRNSYINVEDIPKGAISFKVYHRCFGKCEGICTPDMYSYQKPTCIMCLECKGWFSPQKFVGHVHRKVENRTCHWGFDSRNWHDYLHVALDVENREKYQKILDELKEVEMKEQLKAQQEINYLKRKAEMHMDHSILVPSMGLGPPPPHQPLPPSVVKHRGDQLDIPTSKKSKGLDEASAYQLEYQHYQSLMYAHCAQQQRMVAAGQMSAFRPWPQPKTFMHAAYNAAAVAALSTLPYLSQEPPVLQNPERVVRSTDRERFERTYQPNVALAPRKTHLSQEREKEQRELRERERIEKEREREMERIRELERSREREREFERSREREREFERSREREREFEREREMREREMKKKLQVQQQQQQQQIKQQPLVTGLCEGEIQIKQERAPTPCEMSPTPPPLSNHSEEDRRSCNGPLMESEAPATPLVSPMALSRHKTLPPTHLSHMELQTRRLSLQNSNSSAASASSSSSSSATSTTPTNLTSSTTPPQSQLQQQPLIPAQKLQQQQLHHQHPAPPSATHLQRIPSHHGAVHGPQPYIRQSPSPHAHCNSASCNNPRSPEEFGGSNEITSSTSPLPQTQQQQQHAQTIIATVNHHNKLLPNCVAYGANSNHNSSSGQQQQQQHNDLTGRIRISKNLINQNNIMRTPTPPPHPLPSVTNPTHQHPSHHLPHHQQQQHQQQQPHHNQHPQAGLQIQQTVTAAQNHQQQYDYYKQNQRYYQQQHQQPLTPQQQQQQQRNHNPQTLTANLNHQQQHQQQQQQHSPSQSSNANTPTGLNLTTNLTAASNPTTTTTKAAAPAAVSNAATLQNHDKPHLRTPQAFMNQHQHHLQNGRTATTTTMNSEFELSTDTDDESVNDGEADSSNTLTPWELAIETLRDSRPKDRERLLNMLQRILNENQHYRLQNQQLKELIEVRNEQIAKLQTELQHCQRQLESLQISPMPAAVNGSGGLGNGLITKALRKECDDQMLLRVPLKKSQRREPEIYERELREKELRESEERAQRQCDERIQYNLSQIKRELSESMEEDDNEEDNESSTTTLEQRSPNESSQHNVESTQPEHGQQQSEASSESEQEDEDNEDEQGDQRMSSIQNQKRSQGDDGEEEEKAEENHHKLEKANNQKDLLQDTQPMANDRQTAEESEQEDEEQERECGDEQDDNDDDEEMDEDEEDDEEEERVQAPHTNALSTPPTATTPLSPDSAATAGQLFDSSNSSDESSMKKAQMSASNALAKMNSETNDADDDDEDDDEDADDDGNDNDNHADHDEDNQGEHNQSDNEDSQSHNDQSDNDNSEAEEEQTHKPRHFRVDKVSTTAATPTTNTNIINTSIHQTTTPPNTTTVVLATKASKKLTPTTNNDIIIKQEYL